MKAVLILGGNSIGKTSVVQTVHSRFHQSGAASQWYWLYLDHAGSFFKVKKKEQLDRIRQYWDSPGVAGLVLEGTRGYPSVFQCFVSSPILRQLWIALLRRDVTVSEAQLRARCARSGKRYREDVWTAQKLEYELGGRRYAAALEKFAREYPGPYARVRVQEFWVDLDYRVLAQLDAWLTGVVAG